VDGMSAGTPFQRELGILGSRRSEKGSRQTIVLAVGRQCRKHRSNRGHCSPVPAGTRQVPDTMYVNCVQYSLSNVCGYQSAGLSVLNLLL
jgi:hypothetical protein